VAGTGRRAAPAGPGSTGGDRPAPAGPGAVSVG